MRILFVDTNILLHYTMFDDIDWASLVGQDDVLLVISMAVTRNLDRQKLGHPRKRVRDRAQAVVRKLEAFESAEPHGEVRPQVRLQFLRTDPLIDFGAAQLSKDIDDDWLIASMLAFRDASPGCSPSLVTADLGLRLKARHHGFEVLALPDELRLPEEADATERQLRELKVEREKYEAALPRLKVSFSGGAAYLHKRFSVQAVDAFDVEDQMRQVAAAWPVPDEVPPKPKRREVHLGRKVAPQSDNAPLMQALASLYTTFPKKLLKTRDDFLNSYREYLERRQAFLLNAARTVSVALELHNDGGAPADDVDVFVRFPLDVLIHPEAAKEPPPPSIPVMPPGWASPSYLPQLGRPPWLDGDGAAQPTWALIARKAGGVRGPFLESVHSELRLRYQVGRLKHGFVVELPAFFVTLPESSSRFAAHLPYRIYCGSRPTQESGALDLVIEADAGARREP